MPDILVKNIDLKFVVHSNDMSCRKRGGLGLDLISTRKGNISGSVGGAQDEGSRGTQAQVKDKHQGGKK